MDIVKIDNARDILQDKKINIFTMDDFYDETFYELCKKFTSQRVCSLIESPKVAGEKLKYLRICKCGEKEIITNNKTNMIDYINRVIIKQNYYYDDYCDACKKEIDKKKEHHEQEKLENITITTEKFISTYLYNGHTFNKPLKRDYLYNIINFYNQCDKSTVIEFIKYMNYSDFLLTPYWEIIAWETKRLSEFKCSLCNSKEKKLITHHKNYEHHGEEIEYYKSDLICLCNDCHNKFHDI